MEPNHKYQMVQPKTQTRKPKLPYQDAMMSTSLEKLARETSHTFAKVNIQPQPTHRPQTKIVQPAEKISGSGYFSGGPNTFQCWRISVIKPLETENNF